MTSSPFLVAPVSVVDVQPLSPSFVRVTFGGPELAEFGTSGPAFDQRIKLIFPAASGLLPDIAGAESWWDAWRTLPEDERGSMRTYSIRDVIGEGADRRLVVDLVLHLVPGATGPASTWAAQASVGDTILVVGPRRSTTSGGGIEFDPGTADHIVLAGDETAVPAISRILADLDDDAVGAAFLEVPQGADVVELTAPPKFTITWLPRDGTGVGAALVPAVVEHLGGHAADRQAPDDEVDPDIWETPSFPAAGDPGESADQPANSGVPGLYAWIAGESGVVTALRRHLITELGVDRTQVAFMGYWREGVSMRG